MESIERLSTDIEAEVETPTETPDIMSQFGEILGALNAEIGKLSDLILTSITKKEESKIEENNIVESEEIVDES